MATCLSWNTTDKRVVSSLSWTPVHLARWTPMFAAILEWDWERENFCSLPAHRLCVPDIWNNCCIHWCLASTSRLLFPELSFFFFNLLYSFFFHFENLTWIFTFEIWSFDPQFMVNYKLFFLIYAHLIFSNCVSVSHSGMCIDCLQWVSTSK